MSPLVAAATDLWVRYAFHAWLDDLADDTGQAHDQSHLAVVDELPPTSLAILAEVVDAIDEAADDLRFEAVPGDTHADLVAMLVLVRLALMALPWCPPSACGTRPALPEDGADMAAAVDYRLSVIREHLEELEPGAWTDPVAVSAAVGDLHDVLLWFVTSLPTSRAFGERR